MDLAPFVSSLRRQLVASAQGGGEEAREVAERLSASLEATSRLVLLEALAGAAGEITLELAPASVEVRLRGRDPEFVVTGMQGDHAQRPAMTGEARTPTPEEAAGEGSVSRTTLRLPEHLKRRMEEAAERQGLSVNAWLIRAVTDAVQVEEAPRSPVARSSQTHYTGWAR